MSSKRGIPGYFQGSDSTFPLLYLCSVSFLLTSLFWLVNTKQTDNEIQSPICLHFAYSRCPLVAAWPLHNTVEPPASLQPPKNNEAGKKIASVCVCVSLPLYTHVLPLVLSGTGAAALPVNNLIGADCSVATIVAGTSEPCCFEFNLGTNIAYNSVRLRWSHFAVPIEVPGCSENPQVLS